MAARVRSVVWAQSAYAALAAELFGYSYAHYQDHLGIGNARYERLMPERVEFLERAAAEAWPVARLAKELDVTEDDASDLLDGYNLAVKVVDAANPADSFRNAVRGAVEHAIAGGLTTEESVEALVTQICFRTADLAYLLDVEGTQLSRCSRHLRREPDVRYYEGYFDEDDASPQSALRLSIGRSSPSDLPETGARDTGRAHASFSAVFVSRAGAVSRRPHPTPIEAQAFAWRRANSSGPFTAKKRIRALVPASS